MKLTDGTSIKLGDRVKLNDGEVGTVVCSIDTHEFSESYPAEQWAYLGKGVLVEFPRYGVIHYELPELGIRVVS